MCVVLLPWKIHFIMIRQAKLEFRILIPQNSAQELDSTGRACSKSWSPAHSHPMAFLLLPPSASTFTMKCAVWTFQPACPSSVPSCPQQIVILWPFLGHSYVNKATLGRKTWVKDLYRPWNLLGAIWTEKSRVAGTHADKM